MSWSGGRFGAAGECLLAPNPGIMTLDGTNTWILRARARGADSSIVVDPGPLDEAHLGPLQEAAGNVTQVLLTHGHADHSEAAKEFASRVGCGVRALDPQHRLGGEGLGEGDVVALGDLEVRVVATPGHTSDSLSFVLPSERAVLTGDTVLGRGTTVVAHPDGKLGAYLDSLHRLRDLCDAQGIQHVWPGHGPGHRRRAGRPRLLPRPPPGPPRAGARGGADAGGGRLTAGSRRARVRRRRPGPVGSRGALGARAAGAPARLDDPTGGPRAASGRGGRAARRP